VVVDHKRFFHPPYDSNALVQRLGLAFHIILSGHTISASGSFDQQKYFS